MATESKELGEEVQLEEPCPHGTDKFLEKVPKCLVDFLISDGGLEKG